MNNKDKDKSSPERRLGKLLFFTRMLIAFHRGEASRIASNLRIFGTGLARAMQDMNPGSNNSVIAAHEHINEAIEFLSSLDDILCDLREMFYEYDCSFDKTMSKTNK